MTEASISQQGDIHKLTGQLDFSSVARLLTANGWLQGDQVQIDMSHVEQSNSAGLALLLEWMKIAQQKGLQIKYHNVPEQLLVIARAYGVDQDLPII
ncbi:MAG: STAS domain-containing protein [Gammaproteobacteria bacterium]|nr:STAS domain-containing protein [Gammaproteobacteria bacterium]MCW8909521.1 STAS domain-containing protein [Gammaproteobacteria bacterium]MCW9004396.1 STAS domain-containing protein [Gammaproteobacteria bacterium]MCW9055815.1 STAS domain-containing protein [Gammaproteobacteria bacterium]